MKFILLLLFGTISLLNVFATAYCICHLFNSPGMYAILVSITFSLITLALLGSTFWIWQTGGAFGYGFKTAWILIIFINLLSVGRGNWSLLNGQPNSIIQPFVVVFLTIFMAISPIVWAYIYNVDEAVFKN